MRVLLISQYFLPDPTVGALRVQKVCDALLQAGHSVHVVTSRNPEDVDGWRPADHPRLRVESVRSLPTQRDLYLALKRHFVEEAEPVVELKDGSSQAEAPPPVVHPGLRGHLSRLTTALLRFPDVWTGFTLPAAFAAVSRHRQDPFDHLITTSPPHSTHIAGWLVRRLTRIPWTLEMRDPWTDDPRRERRPRIRWLDALDAAVEARCLRAATRIIALTDGAAALYRAKLPLRDRAKVVTIRSGIPGTPRSARPPGPAGPRRVVYAGALYGERDPEPFLRALGLVVRRRGLGPADLRLRFIGHCSHYHGRSVAALVAREGLAGLTEFVGWVPAPLVEEELASATLAILWARQQPVQVPNKLYEYLGAGVPIFGIVDERGETAGLLRRVGGHTIVDSGDSETLAEALDRALYVAAGSREPGADDLLEELSTARQMERLVRLITGDDRERVR